MGRSGSRKTRQAIFSGSTTLSTPNSLDVIDLYESKNLNLINLKRQQALDSGELLRLKSKFVNSYGPTSWVDFDYLDLSSSDFSNFSGNSFNFGNSDEKWAGKLVSTNFSGAKISKSNFSHCDFRNANLKNAQIIESVFDQTNLSGADMKSASFNHSRFLNLYPGDLNGNIDGTSFRHTFFWKCLKPFSRDQKINFIDFYSADFQNSVFEPGSDFSDSEFSNSNWDQISCQSTDFSRTSFQSSAIERSDFSNSVFFDADFSSANVSNAKFIKADFKDTDLSGSVFVETDFRGAEFPYANINKTVFKRCVFSKSCAKAVFEGSRYKTTTVPDLSEAMNFDTAQFIDCVIESD